MLGDAETAGPMLCLHLFFTCFLYFLSLVPMLNAIALGSPRGLQIGDNSDPKFSSHLPPLLQPF